ncbi:LOW QUALITY PROTEIN: lamin tail domain-containing protein 2 [Desmodus rotundus]|uniref:LOW QUALITY PROTEIN: lamin tail domain-containing protein 2 n=1 Tax=Desmodus rotundus TaxID=9430 RepID=UPI0039E249D9
MAPKSGREGGEAKDGALSSLVHEEPVSGPRGPPAGAPADLVAPEGLKDTKASATRVDLKSAPESLDSRILWLPLGQREPEIQALRCAIQDRRDARHRRILQEVAGLPLERGPRSQDKLLQTQIQKLTLELKEQKGRAQLERERLEEQLLQTQTLLQQREAELQALHKSCLVQLAHSSWVGRMLRSSTGSVEVVTAETLMDPSESSENDQASPAREGFRLEDVDWNTIAHRYPNLFANIKSNSDYKHPWPRTPPRPPVGSPPDECGPESCGRQHRFKSVEWGSPPFVGPDDSRGAVSDSSSWRLDERFGVEKVTGRPPRAPGHISFQHIASPARSFSRDPDAEPEGHCRPVGLPGDAPYGGPPPEQALQNRRSPQIPGKPTQTSPARPPMLTMGLQCTLGARPPPAYIVAVSLSKGFVCILNESAEETADLGGFTLQQLQGPRPVRTYRFPPHTLLEPQHHVTVRPTHHEPARPCPAPAPLTRARHCPQVWGEGPGCAKRRPPSSVGREPVHFHPSPSFATLLLSPRGEVLSKYQAPRCPIPTSRIFDDTDVSIDRFLLSEAQPGADARQQQRPPRPRREARAQSRRPGCGPSVPRSGPPPQVPLPQENHPSDPIGAPPTSALPTLARPPSGWLKSSQSRRPRRTQALSLSLTTSKLVSPQEVPVLPERVESDDSRERLPAVTQDGLSLVVYRSKMEPTVPVSVPTAPALPAPPPGLPLRPCAPQVCRKCVDRGCPMVALSVQSRAKSRFCSPGCLPITVDTCRWV